jgi:hypothetical protein
MPLGGMAVKDGRHSNGHLGGVKTPYRHPGDES